MLVQDHTYTSVNSNFHYNGMHLRIEKKIAPYTASIINWCNEKVAKCKCSDGKTRLIPAILLIGPEKRNR